MDKEQKKQAKQYLAALEKAQPGITTKVFGMPFNPWSIRTEVLGFEGEPREPSSHGLWQIYHGPHKKP